MASLDGRAHGTVLRFEQPPESEVSLRARFELLHNLICELAERHADLLKREGEMTPLEELKDRVVRSHRLTS